MPAASALEWCLGAEPHQYPRSAGAPPGALPAQWQIQSSPGAACCFTLRATPLNDPEPTVNESLGGVRSAPSQALRSLSSDPQCEAVAVWIGEGRGTEARLLGAGLSQLSDLK